MNIGIRLHDTIKADTLEERLDYVKAQGFSCSHIALNKLGMPYAVSSLTPGYAKYIKNAFQSRDIEIAVLGNYLNLAHPDANTIKEFQKRYLANLRFASLLGVSVVGTETGAPNAAYSYEKACHTKEALNTFIRNLEPVVEYAQKLGVILAIEPVYKHIVWNPLVAREVLDSIASPNLQIIFDPVNLLHKDNLSDRRRVIDEAISLLGEDIAIIHLKDYQETKDELISVGCGLGSMDYTDIIDFVKRDKEHIEITLENTTPDNAKECREFVEDLYEKG